MLPMTKQTAEKLIPNQNKETNKSKPSICICEKSSTPLSVIETYTEKGNGSLQKKQKYAGMSSYKCFWKIKYFHISVCVCV